MADHRHKRDTEARRKPKALAVIGPLAVLATASVVDHRRPGAPTPRRPTWPRCSHLVDRDRLVRAERGAGHPLRRTASRPPRHGTCRRRRSCPRPRSARPSRPRRKQHWTTDELNIWTQPGDKAKRLGEIDAGKKVLVTGRELWGRTEIVIKGQSRWVTDGYLPDDKPVGVGAGLSMEPCPDGGVESGLTDNAVYVYRSVCNAFPEITSYGGWNNHGEHSSGRAIDIMISDVELGTAIAEFLREHASELHLYDVIWRQHIWTPDRASEGWRYDVDARGSATAEPLRPRARVGLLSASGTLESGR